jgi:hypothetical protein
MSAAEEAARLREQADALEAEAKLESKLADAKEAYRKNTDDAKAKERLHKVRDDITAARQARRGEGVSIGGDAFQSNGNGNGNEG